MKYKLFVCSVSSLSGRRGSNSRPSAWKADALSTELLPHSLAGGLSGTPKVAARKHRPSWQPLLSATENHKRTIHHLLMNCTFGVWERMDSNHRRRCQQIYSLPHLATLELSRYFVLLHHHHRVCSRADGGIRTPDQLITNQLLWPTELHRHLFALIWGCKYMRNFLCRKILVNNFPKIHSNSLRTSFSPLASNAKG